MSVINEVRKREVGEPEGKKRKISPSRELEWKEFWLALKKKKRIRSFCRVKIISVDYKFLGEGRGGGEISGFNYLRNNRIANSFHLAIRELETIVASRIVGGDRREPITVTVFQKQRYVNSRRGSRFFSSSFEIRSRRNLYKLNFNFRPWPFPLYMYAPLHRSKRLYRT